MIEVYTDGSATTKDKPGGYGWVIVIDGQFHSEGSGSLPLATNNDAELEAAIMGLAHACKIAFSPINILGRLEPVEIVPPEVTLVSDSQIILGWLSGHYRFKQESKRPKYEAFMRLKKMMNVTGRWVEGHSGDQWNERCDKLAGEARDLAMGRVPRKKSTKSTLMLKAIKEIANIAELGYDYEYDSKWKEVMDLCKPFLGNK